MTFSDDLAKFSDKAKGRMADVVRKVVIDVGERLVMRSPVGDGTLWQTSPPPGYVGGRFRANWQYGYGSMPPGDLPDIDKTGAASNTRIRSGVTGAPVAGIHYICNNLPYAQRLEDGYSKQAPTGMVALTVVEFGGVVQGAAK